MLIACMCLCDWHSDQQEDAYLKSSSWIMRWLEVCLCPCTRSPSSLLISLCLLPSSAGNVFCEKHTLFSIDPACIQSVSVPTAVGRLSHAEQAVIKWTDVYNRRHICMQRVVHSSLKTHCYYCVSSTLQHFTWKATAGSQQGVLPHLLH